MADRFTRAFGGFLRRIIDMGDGTFSERIVAAPPPDMLAGDRLKVELDEPVAVTLPAAMVTSDRLKVEVDDPIDVVLPAAMVIANRLQVDVSQPVAITHPANLVTGTSKPRLRVDPGQTGFFEGRMFRSFFNGVIPVAGPTVQFRFTAPINFILWTQTLELTQGALQLEVYTGATSSGSWTAVPILGLNRMSEAPLPTYVSQITIETGGNFTGGTRVDFMQVRAAAQNNTASNVGQEFSERGLPAAVFHGRLSTLAGGLTVNDAAQYVYRLAWEERP
jgi:hypothetical protein